MWWLSHRKPGCRNPGGGGASALLVSPHISSHQVSLTEELGVAAVFTWKVSRWSSSLCVHNPTHRFTLLVNITKADFHYLLFTLFTTIQGPPKCIEFMFTRKNLRFICCEHRRGANQHWTSNEEKKWVLCCILFYCWLNGCESLLIHYCLSHWICFR